MDWNLGVRRRLERAVPAAGAERPLVPADHLVAAVAEAAVDEVAVGLARFRSLEEAAHEAGRGSRCRPDPAMPAWTASFVPGRDVEALLERLRKGEKV